MRLGIVVAVLLGMVAAVFAAVVVRGVLAERGRTARIEEVEVVVAAGEFPAMTVVTVETVQMKKVPAKGLNPRHLTAPSHALGRILGMPVVPGQVLTTDCFIEGGTAAQVAASLPDGMRAVTITMNQSMITGGLLYPGSVVDVLVAFDIRGSRDRGEALSTVLLRGIHVLAVQAKSVAARQEETESPRREMAGPLTVTLMVDSKQAEALQLATVHGTVSLALRNPLDTLLPVDTEPTVLNQGRLAQLGAMMRTTVDRAVDGQASPPIMSSPGESTPEGGEALRKKPWPVTLIKGATATQVDFDEKQG